MVTAGDDEAWARFVWACVHDRPAAGRMLDADPSLSTRKRGSETALHWLAVEGHRDAVEFLLQRGADPDPRGAGDSTALMDVCRLGNLELAELLLRHGADPAARNYNGSVLCAAAGSGNGPLVRRILQAGVRLDGEDGEEAVVDAVRAGAADVLRLLLGWGAAADFLNGGSLPVFAFLPKDDGGRARIEEVLRAHGISRRAVYEKHDQRQFWTFDEWLQVVCGEGGP